MRSIVVALLGCWGCAFCASSAHAEFEFPYRAYANAEEVYVRSGPGQDYYPTEKLKRGQQVEVYRHDPGGWCAIRPVDGSFTWVSARFVKPTEHHLGTITDEGVSARVGSRFSDVRDVIQVRLHRGEVVEILERPQGDAGGWYKIAPPAGEFRWVSSKFLDPDEPRDDADRDGRRDRRDTAYSRGHRLTPQEFQAELERIELELSVMVIDNPSVWSFGPLRERTNRLLDDARTTVDRGRARALADKIARFDDIRRRQEAVLAMRERTDRAGRLYARLRPRDDDNNNQEDVDGRYDGVGQLTQVVSPKVGAPRYALLDRSGNVRCYVTPAPGVRLQDYVGREVGVIGMRGYIPEQHASHVMARHVTPLEGQNLLR